MKDKTTEIFKNAPVPKAVLNNAIPSIISMIMVLAYNLADTFLLDKPKMHIWLLQYQLPHLHFLYLWL